MIRYRRVTNDNRQYIRWCRRCKKYYKSEARNSKVCLDCNRSDGAKYWKEKLKNEKKNRRRYHAKRRKNKIRKKIKNER